VFYEKNEKISNPMLSPSHARNNDSQCTSSVYKKPSGSRIPRVDVDRFGLFRFLRPRR